jgi:hypothetical protein
MMAFYNFICAFLLVQTGPPSPSGPPGPPGDTVPLDAHIWILIIVALLLIFMAAYTRKRQVS